MSTYIFIDGGYLRRAHAQSVHRWFGFEPELDVPSAIGEFTRLAQSHSLGTTVVYSAGVGIRSFYYDCIDEDRKPSETDETFARKMGSISMSYDFATFSDGLNQRSSGYTRFQLQEFFSEHR